jgi:SAM-dependent methyltransferase
MAANLHRYLTAKKTVDDRALNHVVLDHLRAEIATRDVVKLRVLEVGAGLGTMVARLVEWGVLSRAEYLLLDVDPQLLEDARGWLLGWAGQRGLRALAEADRISIEGDGIEMKIRFVQAEIGAFLEQDKPGPLLPRADLLIANAVLDLVDVPRVLPPLFDLAVPRGLYWFSINYDGETIFQPEHPDDEAFMRLFHRSMDERVRYGRPAGESRTGRHLFGHLRAAGASILAAGPSDWVVHPGEQGYPADEAHFLHLIIDFVDEALAQYPEVDAQKRASWVALRRQQIDRGELVYLAHQLDFLGRCP